MLLALLLEPALPLLLVLAFILGGATNPLYSLLMAHTNDYLAHEDMASASGGMIFINGLGAVTGPLILGWAMERFGANAFFVYVGTMLLAVALYAMWRMTRRPAVAVEDQAAYAAVFPTASPVAVELSQEMVAERAQEDAEEAGSGAGSADTVEKDPKS